ncbi:MAG: hypothetical protein AB1611_04025, partial [bacterium]
DFHQDLAGLVVLCVSASLREIFFSLCALCPLYIISLAYVSAIHIRYRFKREARSQKSEVRSQKPGVRSQESEVRSQKSEEGMVTDI